VEIQNQATVIHNIITENKCLLFYTVVCSVKKSSGDLTNVSHQTSCQTHHTTRNFRRTTTNDSELSQALQQYKMATIARRIVSKNKRRIQSNGYDLDLTCEYILSLIIFENVLTHRTIKI
jgi:uncharacterized membrane protein